MRNPIYFSVILILLGHFLWFGNWSLLLYAGAAFVGTHVFVTLYEESTLRKRFGAACSDYLGQVPRWVSRVKQASEGA